MTSSIIRSALVTGTVASVVCAGALALLAKTEKKSALQPVNATSHWLNGAQAADRNSADAAHTLVGYATHHASAVFWALPFQAWLNIRPPRSTLELVRDATIMSGIAAAVDYRVVPRRFTPGWELALSKASLFAAYAALAIGLFAGARIAEKKN
jgi:hypothetical protein